MITDGDPTIVNGTTCPDPANCVDQYCPMAPECSDPIDLQRAVDAANILKNNPDINAKVITVTRSPPVSPEGIQNLLTISSCPDDNQPNCADSDKQGTTAFVAPDFEESLLQVLINIPRLAICNTGSPTSVSPTFSPTNSPTFKSSEAPSPPTCCNCQTSPSPNRYLTTKSPTPSRCFDDSGCPTNCTCLPDNITRGVIDNIPNGRCFNRCCLDNCYDPHSPEVFCNAPPPTFQPTRAPGTPFTAQPTPRKTTNLWLLPFLLGLSGHSGGPLPHTTIDVYHIIHGTGRRLLASTVACGTTPLTCPDPSRYRCENNVCIPLPVCTVDANCTSTTFCDTQFKVCRAKGFLHEPCDVRPCVEPLICFSNLPTDRVPKCVSESCIRCCECGADAGTTCSPTPALAPGVVYKTLAPTTRAPSPKIRFNPWLLLFLFPGPMPARYPRPGGSVTIDIYHIIHARQKGFVPGTRVCTNIQANQKWTTTAAPISLACNNAVQTQADCCKLCTDTPTCVAWEFNAETCADPTRKSCRTFTSAGFDSTQKDNQVGAVIGLTDTRPNGTQFCTTTADCWNPGAFPTDEGDGRQWCTDLNGLEPVSQCRTICSADNTCVQAPDLDYCWKIPDQNSEFGYCVDGGEHCICQPDQCNLATPPFGLRCCPAPQVCCED